MSYVIATPEMMATAAFDLARIGSQVSAASAVAAMPTTEVVAAGADEVSAGIAALFSAHAQEYQALSAQAAAFHDQFVHTLTAAARWYTATEIANAAAMRVVLGAVNAPTQTLLGRPLIGDGAHGTAPGQPQTRRCRRCRTRCRLARRPARSRGSRRRRCRSAGVRTAPGWAH